MQIPEWHSRTWQRVDPERKEALAEERKTYRPGDPRVQPRMLDNVCHWCGLGFSGSDPKLRRSREHLIPRSEGGGGLPDNIVAAHTICNTQRKSDTRWVPFAIHGRLGVRVPYDDERASAPGQQAG